MVRLAIAEGLRILKVFVTDTPEEFPDAIDGTGLHTGDVFVDGQWQRPDGWAEQVAAANEEEIKKTESKSDISNDDLINILQTKSTAEIETYVASLFSNLASMTAEQIDTYITNEVVDLPSAKAAIGVIAKDVAETMRVLKIVTKIAVYTIKKVGI